ncbi:MAG: 3-deoxy-manno-octulosonate cytidylyltransferase (CMP-KDO synthetase), partial [Spirosomataceae bacterium]
MSSVLKTVVIVPARYASTRFLGKPLVEIDGKSMVQRVCEQAEQTNLVDKVIVATDSELISSHVKNVGFDVIMTSESHTSGTERCAEALEKLTEEFDIVINVQGDEPFIAPELIEEVIKGFDETTEIVTAVKKITGIET